MNKNTEIKRAILMNCMNENASNSLCIIRTSLEALELHLMKALPGESAGECRRLLDSANSQLAYLCRLLNNVGSMLDGCTGRIRAQLQPMPLTSLLYNLCQEAGRELERRGLAGCVRVEPPMDEVLMVRGVPVLAESLLVILVPGLIRLGGGSGELTICLSHREETLCADFAGEGTALPEKLIAAMQESDEESCLELTEEDGFGVWLAAVYARAMNWHISAENRDTGCVVRLEMPKETVKQGVLLRSETESGYTLAVAIDRLRREFDALFPEYR